MATTKKAPAKKKTTATKSTTKAAAVKKTPAKKPVTKKTAASAAKRTTTTRSSAKKTSAKHGGYKSFRVARDADEFTNFQITRQTIYWIVLIAFIIFAQLWILKLQIEVATLIEAQQLQIQNY